MELSHHSGNTRRKRYRRKGKAAETVNVDGGIHVKTSEDSNHGDPEGQTSKTTQAFDETKVVPERKSNKSHSPQNNTNKQFAQQDTVLEQTVQNDSSEAVESGQIRKTSDTISGHGVKPRQKKGLGTQPQSTIGDSGSYDQGSLIGYQAIADDHYNTTATEKVLDASTSVNRRNTCNTYSASTSGIKTPKVFSNLQSSSSLTFVHPSSSSTIIKSNNLSDQPSHPLPPDLGKLAQTLQSSQVCGRSPVQNQPQHSTQNYLGYSYSTTLQTVAQPSQNIIESSKTSKDQKHIFEMKTIPGNKIMGPQPWIAPHLRGLKQYVPETLYENACIEVAKKDSASLSNDLNESHNTKFTASSATQSDLTSSRLNHPLSQTSEVVTQLSEDMDTQPATSYADIMKTSSLSQDCTFHSAKGKNAQPATSYADIIKTPSKSEESAFHSIKDRNISSATFNANIVQTPSKLQVMQQSSKSGPSVLPQSNGITQPGPVSILKKPESQGPLEPLQVAPHLRGIVKIAENTQSAETAHVRFDDPAQQVGDKRTKLVQQLATNEEPLKIPEMSNVGELNNGKLPDNSAISNDGQGPVGQQSNATPKVDDLGFEITQTKLEYELAGWDGNWAPPPIEWDARPAFNNNDARHIKFIEKWMNERVTEALESPRTLDLKSDLYTSGEGPASGLQRFLWSAYPVNWTTHRPDDPFTNTPENLTQTSRTSQKEFMKNFDAEKKKSRAETKELQDYNRKHRRSTIIKYPNKNSPIANIYIRPTQQTDLAQITAIYNCYVKDCPLSRHLEPVDQDEWRDNFRQNERERLPFLVAVLKNTKRGNESGGVNGNGRNARRNNQRGGGPLVETIVGFAMAEDYAGRGTAFQYTSELMLFVHPQHQRLGVANTLLDRMMAALDPVYTSKNGTEFIYNGLQCYELGGTRDVHKVLISIGYFPTKPQAYQWQKKWLAKDWGFEQVADLPGIGVKNGKSYNYAQFIRTTNVQCGVCIWPVDKD